MFHIRNDLHQTQKTNELRSEEKKKKKNHDLDYHFNTIHYYYDKK